MKEIIELFKSVVIQIATPYSKGTGFYVKDYDLIVTNEHVVRGNREVVIDSSQFDRQLVEVLFVDEMHDLAFLSVPRNVEIPEVNLGKIGLVKEGDHVVAIGHPFGLKYTTTQGIISSTFHQQNDITYLQHDAALNPGNSGGPLLNMRGEIVGVNTFMIRDGENIGFSLPINYLKETILEYQKGDGRSGVRCTSCANMVFDAGREIKYCPHCGAKITLPAYEEVYEPVGVSKTIEELLLATGHNVKLSRRGPNNWEIHQGSAKINITYHEKTGLIIGDAFLCNLPKERIGPLYEYLLKQNYLIEGLTFSVNPKGHDIILSLLIYDRYLNVNTGIQLFKHLFEKADHYDDILVNEFGAIWKQEE
ncbi:MAG: trypsin-like peptidase domain-containing protein [Bacteroidota bacterium]